MSPDMHARQPVAGRAVLPNQAAADAAEVDAANRVAVAVIHALVPADAALAHAAGLLRAVGVDLAGAEALGVSLGHAALARARPDRLAVGDDARAAVRALP